MQNEKCKVYHLVPESADLPQDGPGLTLQMQAYTSYSQIFKSYNQANKLSNTRFSDTIPLHPQN